MAHARRCRGRSRALASARSAAAGADSVGRRRVAWHCDAVSRLAHDACALGTLARRILCAPGVAGRGIGRKLVAAIEAAAQRLGFAQLYAGSGGAASLLVGAGWHVLERVSYHGEEIAILRRGLAVNV
jgi:GNAT superfamily N-acetyltransferase